MKKTQISSHVYERVLLREFIIELAKNVRKRDISEMDIYPAVNGCIHRRTVEFEPIEGKKLTVGRTFDQLSHFIPENAIVIAETGQSLFSTAEVLFPKGVTFISQVFYGSIGFTLGATLGACFAANNRPVLLFIGDGSFQETCQDLSTMIRYKMNPIIFLLNNEGYLVERMIDDGCYNDIQPWKYHKLPEVFCGHGKNFDIWNESELALALKVAEKHLGENLTFIELHTGKYDASENMRTAGISMAKSNSVIS